MAEGNNNLAASLMDNCLCKICFEVLDDPVQCQNNEHYFCRKCITKHLHDNTETCPFCADQLTLETLRPPSRIILDLLSHTKKPRGSYVSRGFTENVKVLKLFLHEQTCGYAPRVVCSNEGRKETVNRRDKESHETQQCKFKMIACESCMFNRDNGKQECTSLRKDVNEMKLRLREITETLNKMAAAQTEFLGKFKAYDESIKDLQDPRRLASSSSFQREGSVTEHGQIFIFGGVGEDTYKSLEVFSWPTKTWTLVEDCLLISRSNSYAFRYGKRIMICGGDDTYQIEFLNPNETGFTSFMFPARLPKEGVVSAVPFETRLVTFGAKVQVTLLQSPWGTRTLLKKNIAAASRCCVELFDRDIFVVRNSKVQRYDTVWNKLTRLSSLPHKVSNTATVAYKDNIIILGGQVKAKSSVFQPLNDVLMYNINSFECKRLPSMLEKRARCAAVIMGDVIVVMGGLGRDGRGDVTNLKSVEYYDIAEGRWHELPPLNLARYDAAACVYV